MLAGPYLAVLLIFLAVCLGAGSSAKGTAVVCILAALAAIIFGFSKLREQMHLPFLVLTLLVLMNGASMLYALSGKFALYEFDKVITAYCLILILLAVTDDKDVPPGQRIAAVLERTAALVGLVSIDMLSTHLISTPVLTILDFFSPGYASLGGVEAGIRMTSLLSNPNVFAGCAGIGVLLSLGLAVSARSRKERIGHVVCLFINALAFVLAFSMGATVFIAIAFLAYLALEFKERRADLFLLMVETLVVTMAGTVLISKTSFQEWSGFQPVPLLCVVLGAAVLCLLDQYLGSRAAEKLAKHSRALLVGVICLVAAGAAFILAAYNLTGAVTLQQGESLRRSIYPQPGNYSLVAQVDGPVKVSVESQNRQDTMMHTSTVLYEGDLSGASFTVPEDSLVVYLNFTAGQTICMERVDYQGDDAGTVPLGYKLLPGFVANRIQGLFANQNAIQRVVFFEDGLKLFLRGPVFGLGLGSFENGIMSVQSFLYETKYAHNHYIQALVDTGAVGLLLFVGLLVTCGAAVLLARRKEGAAPLTPMLGAALVFMAGHAAVELVFSANSYLPFAFGVFALINLCCGVSLPVPSLSRKMKQWGLVGSAVLMAVFLFLLWGNMAANRMVKENPTFGSLKVAAALDRFEGPDYMLSYVVSSSGYPDDTIIQSQAAEYAERLSKLDSNTVPLYLAEFYLRRGDKTQGLAMLEKYVRYVSSDPKTWEGAIEVLAYYGTSADIYREGAGRIVQLLEEWNAENIGKITLSESTQELLKAMGV